MTLAEEIQPNNSHMKTCSLAYLPPPNVKGAPEFLANLSTFRTANDLVLYSDHDYPNKDVVRISASPEFICGATYSDGRENKWALNNLIFLTGLKIVVARGYSHFLYLEADCRIGCDDWDKFAFDEFIQRNPEAICAGTIACYNPCNRDIEFSRAWNQFIARHQASQFPITSYGSNGASEKLEPAIFANGALTIYQIDWLKTQFAQTGTVALAQKITAFDYEIGRRLVREFGPKAFDKLTHMDTMYSGYGEVQTTEEERQTLLTSGKVVAVHQIKSTWAGPGRIADLHPMPASVEPATALTPAPVNPNPKVEIFIVSYTPDIPYLIYNLRSIRKFCTGFSGLTVLVPIPEFNNFMPLRKEFEFRLAKYQIPTDKTQWHIAHQLAKMYADQHCGGDYILHTDSDCIFTKPTMPADFFLDGKPILCIEPFANLTGNPWKPVVEDALGIKAKFETMRRHGAVHPRAIYKECRTYIEKKQHKNFNQWWMAQKADYPWGVTEFNFLGNYALRAMADSYRFIDVSKETPPESPIKQFWSHLPPDVEQEFPSGGKGVPLDIIRSFGLDKRIMCWDSSEDGDTWCLVKYDAKTGIYTVIDEGHSLNSPQ